MMRRKPALCLFLLFLGVAQPGAGATTWYVGPSSHGLGNGTSWANAFGTVTAGLAASHSGDDVLVAVGTYAENIVVPSGVRLIGGYNPYNAPTNATSTLDGNENGAVVEIAANATAATTVQGFTIQHGSGRTIFKPPFPIRIQGGGIYAPSGSPTIRSNTIQDNSADEGGGLYLGGNASVTANVIEANRARMGGGLSCATNTPVMTNNTFRDNVAETGGGAAIRGTGYGVFRNNIFERNRGGSEGSALFVGSQALLNNNTLLYNSGGGAAIDVWDAGNLFAFNNIVAFNSAGLRSQTTSVLTFEHNDVYANTAFNYAGQLRLNGTLRNISVDPAMVSATDYRLRAYSPCVDAGDTIRCDAAGGDKVGAPRVQGGGVDMGAYETATHSPRPAIRVSPTGNDGNDGASWATAKRTVQAAVDAAGNDHEVWVAAGTYGRVEIYENIALYGGFDGTEGARWQRDPAANVTILDGGGSDSVVTINGTDVTIDDRAVLDGFTVRNGRGWLGPSRTHFIGGGLRIVSASPTITNNIIRDNEVVDYYRVGYGGGIYSTGGAPVIACNRIKGNHALSGGGIWCSNSNATIAYNLIEDNAADGLPNYPAGSMCEGSGLRLASAGSMVVEHNWILDNDGWDHGGGMYLTGEPSRIIRNVFADNSAAQGGALYVENCGTEIISNLIHHNTAMKAGSAIRSWRAGPKLYNNTLVDNNCGGSGGALALHNPWTANRNNIVAFNSGGGIVIDPDNPYTPDVSRNLVFANGADYIGLSPGAGDIQQDPGFLDRPARNYRLIRDAPPVDAGDDALVAPGDVDVDGWPRRAGSHVDMGACETSASLTLTLPDAIHALRLAAGLFAATATSLAAYDEPVWGDPSSGRIDLTDAARLVRQSAGLE